MKHSTYIHENKYTLKFPKFLFDQVLHDLLIKHPIKFPLILIFIINYTQYNFKYTLCTYSLIFLSFFLLSKARF